MATWNPEWLDSMYNNRALVPDFNRHFVQWQEASDDARQAHAHVLDIPYGSGTLEKLDIFPGAKKGAPVVVFIHGGYWRSLDKSQHSFIAPAFKNEGACVVMPNYSLCPDVTIPQIALQMVQALVWTWKNISRYGGDRNRMTVIGHSAGGHLATMLLACQWQQVDKKLPPDLVKGVLSISGLYDLEPLMYAPNVKDSLMLTPGQVTMASPARFPRPAQGQLYTVAGADESAEFLRHNLLMRKAWGRKMVPVCETVKQRNHFSVLEDLTAPWTRLHQLASKLVFSAV